MATASQKLRAEDPGSKPRILNSNKKMATSQQSSSTASPAGSAAANGPGFKPPDSAQGKKAKQIVLTTNSTETTPEAVLTHKAASKPIVPKVLMPEIEPGEVTEAETDLSVVAAEADNSIDEGSAMDDGTWKVVGKAGTPSRGGRKPDSKHDEKAALVLVIDGIDNRRFQGRLSILKELQRIAIGVQTSAVVILQRGGVAVTCATTEDKDMLRNSPYWGDNIEPPFGPDASMHEPRSISGGSTRPNPLFNEAKKVVFDSIPADATKEDILEELGPHGAVNATLFRRKFGKMGLASWMVETSSEEEAVYLIEKGIGFFGLLLRARPCRSIKPPIRCSKCQEFGHAGIVCRNEPKCSECSGPHFYGDLSCPAKAKKVSGVPGGKTCPNCKAAGRSELDHSAGWGGCPENKTQRQMLYAEIAAKHQTDAALSEAKKAAADDKAKEQELAANQIRAEIQGSCISSFCGMLTLFMEALLSGIAGDTAKSATVLDRQLWMLDQFEKSMGHLPVPFTDIRQKFKLKPAAPKK
jgi:hypothetical protein